MGKICIREPLLAPGRLVRLCRRVANRAGPVLKFYICDAAGQPRKNNTCTVSRDDIGLIVAWAPRAGGDLDVVAIVLVNDVLMSIPLLYLENV